MSVQLFFSPVRVVLIDHESCRRLGRPHFRYFGIPEVERGLPEKIRIPVAPVATEGNSSRFWPDQSHSWPRWLTFQLELVDWISIVCGQMNLSLHTVHLAVKYLDHFMDGHNIVHNQLRFVAVCCIILAAKVVEVDEEVRTNSRLRSRGSLSASLPSF